MRPERRHGLLLLFLLAPLLILETGRIASAQGPESGTSVVSAVLDADDAGDQSTPLPSLEVHDQAGLFDAQSLADAEALFRDAARPGGASVLIETVERLDDRSIDEVALERARQSGRSGVYLLVSGQPKEVTILVSRDYQEQVGPGDRRKALGAFLNSFEQGEFGNGLKDGLAALVQAVEGERPGVDDEANGGNIQNVGVSRPLVSRDHIRLSLGGAEVILQAAQQQAETMGLKVNIAVVDDGGHLVAFARMDGARPGSGYTAQTKAVAAATFRNPTGPIPPGADDPEPILNIGLALTAMAGGGRATPLYGGVPIEVEGQIIGAVGVGGGTGEQDAEIARAGIAELLQALGPRSPVA